MKGKEISELYRTFSPKYTQYAPDGCGRDNFIIFNNGGLLRGGVKTLKKHEDFGVSKKLEYHSLKKNVAPFKYRSDGSGRDSYVLFEHAGLERDIKSLSSYHLKDFLRKYEPSATTSRYHDFKPVWMNRKEFLNLKTTNAIQKNVIKRLYYDEKGKFTASMDRKPVGNMQILPDININSIKNNIKNNNSQKKEIENNTSRKFY